MNNETHMTPVDLLTPTTDTQPPVEPERKKRTRAKRSCDKCRLKKSRCDAYLRTPCTKCKQSNSSCTFLIKQKKRGPNSNSHIEILENRLLRMEKLLKNMSKDRLSDTSEAGIAEHNYEAESTTSSANNNESDTESTPSTFVKDVCFGSLNNDENISDRLRSLTISDYERTRYIGGSSGIHFLDEPMLRTHDKRRISSDPSWFVQKLNDEAEEHVFIRSKEIESPTFDVVTNLDTINRLEIFEDVPFMTQGFLDYLVHIYFTRIHPICPILNKIQFLEQYYLHTPSPPDKYILFTIAYNIATIFKFDILDAGVFCFSEQQYDQLAACLKNKSHRLLNLIYKRSMISTVQALIIMSMVVMFEENDDEDTSHWMISGMAIRMAQDLGLHRDCSNWPIPDYEIETRKRIWYAAYIMDRVVAADLGRPVSIIDSEFEVSLPSPLELSYQSKVLEQHNNYAPILIVEAEEIRRQQIPIYSAFTQLITLTQLFGQVLIGLHSPKAKQARYSNLNLVDILDRNLANWKMSLPVELQVDAQNIRGSINPFAATVNLLHYCVVLLLYRPFINEDSQLALKALNICTSAAISILNIAEGMDYDYYISLPWNISVFCTFQAAIIFLHNSKGGNEYFKKQGKENLYRCKEVFYGYPSLDTNRVVKILNCVIDNFDDNVVFTTCTRTVTASQDPQTRRNRRNERQKRFKDAHFMDLYTPHSTLPKLKSKLPSERLPALILDTNDYRTKESNSLTNVPSQQPQTSNITTMPGQADYDVQNLAKNFTSTRPEDIFISSLSVNLGSREKNQISDGCQQTMHQALSKPIYSTPEQQQSKHQHTNSIPQFNHTQYPNSNTLYQTTNFSQEQIDSSGLCSKVPVCDLPSGVTWNAWESFINHTVQ